MAPNAERSGNQLLDTLDSSFNEFVTGKIEKVSLPLKHVCYEANRPIRHIYFPTDGIVSWVQDVGEGKVVEVATVGNEGFVGVPVLLGADRTPGTSFCQVAGAALKLSVNELPEVFAKFPELVRILHRYVQALVVQIAQGNACNGSHSLEQRCAR